jgi:repressor LexA
MDKNISNKELEALRHIRNSLLHKSRMPSVRELMSLMDYKSPRSAAVLLGLLIEKKILNRKNNGDLVLAHIPDELNRSRALTVNVPLVGKIACGTPILAEENLEAMIPVSVKLARPPYKYFLLRAVGDSMNQKNIKNGDLVLVRQQETAENGDVVVALIDDGATIKQLYVSKDAVILKPRSSNKKHQQIILDCDFRIQGIVVATVPKV